MKAHDWDLRYGQTDLMWSQGPNEFVEEVTSSLAPGRALDLAAGEGRNAIWLAARGWQTTAADFSAVALERASRIALERLGPDVGRFTTWCSDLTVQIPPAASFDLVTVVYLQIEQPQRTFVMQAAARAVAPGGTLLVIAHDSENLQKGHGGPPNSAVLYSAADVVSDIGDSGLEITRSDLVTRVVQTDEGPRNALDCLVVGVRPIAGR